MKKNITIDNRNVELVHKNSIKSKEFDYVLTHLCEDVNCNINFSMASNYCKNIKFVLVDEFGFGSEVYSYTFETGIQSTTFANIILNSESSTYTMRILEIGISTTDMGDATNYFSPLSISFDTPEDNTSISIAFSSTLDSFKVASSSLRDLQLVSYDKIEGFEGSPMSSVLHNAILTISNTLSFFKVDDKSHNSPYYYEITNSAEIITSGTNTMNFDIKEKTSGEKVLSGRYRFTAQKKEVIDIELITIPTKIVYNYRDTIDLTNGIVRLFYINGTYEDISLPNANIKATTEASYQYGYESDKIVDITETSQYIYINHISCGERVRYAVNVNSYSPSSLNDVLWETISIASQKGKLGDYFTVGDSKDITLNGTFQSLTFSDNQYTAILANIDSENCKSIFTIGDKIAFTEYDVSSVSEDPTYSSPDKVFAMNTTNTNVGGWSSSNMRNILQSFVNVLPLELQNILKPFAIYSDNVGNGTESLENITETQDKIFIPSEYEMMGTNIIGNHNESSKQTQWQMYVDVEGSNKVKIQNIPGQTISSTPANYWLRSVSVNNDVSFVGINEFGLVEPKNGNKVLGINPCFGF